MSRPRGENCIPLAVDIDGIEIPAHLVPPGSGRACYYVRWKIGGRWIPARTTGHTILHEAKRAAAEMIRGKPRPKESSPLTPLSRCLQIQRDYWRTNGSTESSPTDSHLKFETVWRNFELFLEDRAWCPTPVTVVQHVTDKVAADYLRWLLEVRDAAAWGVHSKYGVLRAAWNRIRTGSPNRWGGLDAHEYVEANPWDNVRSNLPPVEEKEPVQLDIRGGAFNRLHDHFYDRPVLQSFLLTSLWAGGRLNEMIAIEWSWLVKEQGFIDIPNRKAKWGTGRVFRIPLRLVERLANQAIAGSPYVFAGVVDEWRRISKRHAHRILDFDPDRTGDSMGKHISKAASKLECGGVTHHSIRRTSMELNEMEELRQATRRSAAGFNTSVDSMTGFYLTKFHPQRYYATADRLYQNMLFALSHLPKVADIMMVEEIQTPRASIDYMADQWSRLSEVERREVLRRVEAGEQERTKRTG